LLRHDPTLQVLLSNAPEGRSNESDWQGLPIRLQRSLLWRKRWRRHHFEDLVTVHFPYDTMLRLNELEPPVIVSGELGARTLQAAIYRKLNPTTRLVIWATVSEITELDRGALRHRLRRFLFKCADAVIVNGSSGERYVRGYGVAQAGIFRVPQTTDTRPFLSLPLPTRQDSYFRLLYCGRLVEFKGLVLFHEQLASWAVSNPQSKIEWTLAGEGPIKEALANASRPSNLTLHFLGHVPYDELPRAYLHTNYVVFPSLADEWGLAVVEALAAGRPVIGSVYSQAVEDLVISGKNGWTFRTDHPEEVIEALNQAFATTHSVFSEACQSARDSVRDLTPESMACGIWAAVNYTRSRLCQKTSPKQTPGAAFQEDESER
jgi:glycosyltransferase involved in cell wall biosynthesis